MILYFWIQEAATVNVKKYKLEKLNIQGQACFISRTKMMCEKCNKTFNLKNACVSFSSYSIHNCENCKSVVHYTVYTSMEHPLLDFAATQNFSWIPLLYVKQKASLKFGSQICLILY